MRQNSIHSGRDEAPEAPTAHDRGWDDTLYPDGRAPKEEAPSSGKPPGEDSGKTSGGRGSGGGAKGGKGGEGAGNGGKRRVLRWSAIVLALLILVTAGAGYLYYQHLNGNLGRDILNLGDNKLDRSGPNAAGQRPLNILLLGSDSRNSEKNIALGGSRADKDRPPLADVQMMLHVSADRSSMSVLSIPRDTRTTIPKCTDPDDGRVYEQTTGKINSSLQRGGPGCTVATWEELTGIPVDHFMMIDFAGVVSMADAVGGVPVCVDNNVKDPQSHLTLRKGTSVVKGEQALHWLRTRHGFADGSDIGRARAQHMYMNSMVRQLKAGTKLTDPGRLRALAEAATKALTVDEGLGSVKKLYDLGSDLQRVPTKRITMATMPWAPAPAGDIVPKEDEADKVFSLIRHDVALDGKDRKKPREEKSEKPVRPTSPKSDIPVQVMNGTGSALQAPVTGRAATVTGTLTQQGFTGAVADSTPKSQADTTLSYAEASQRPNALAVAKALGLPERAVKHSTGVTGVTLVVGSDWREGASFPAGPGDDLVDDGKTGAEDTKTPDSAEALNGGDKKACMEVNPSYTW